MDLTIDSRAVAKAVTVRVQVPRGWQPDATGTWPVVFALGGGDATDTQTIWTDRTGIAQVAAGWNVLLVMPDPSPAGFTDWFNYGAFGTPAWETFHTLELRQLIERNLHGSDQRAVIGVSSGGHGALTMAGRHPGMFKFAASYSGPLNITLPGVDAQLVLLNLSNGDPFRVFGIPYLNYANWQANNPYDLVGKLRGVSLFVSSGTTGNHGPLDPDMSFPDAVAARLVGGASEQIVGLTNISFISHAQSLGIPVTTDLYGDGWHQWAYWDREMKRSWPQAMQAIGATKTP